ncbi:glycosyltransferase family A protein [Dermatophilus congolensis]|uniref:Chondroitin polymerase n=1 Tax=Dermatophilus congolensis TaxID=1863 RepID=A0A239VDI2_9MICO|nr:glycosyltransferase family A protein [Dermatophilus congolensis]MBO3128724.1 glycosyltransferase family 2 protein [Dermatophilus congolensis]MBO3132639.1 glycosyltransferase family 2 protein [Dermatophilus congolensis]MBO3133200.1 glycosyltransferase family 2 protein [Dermatophilus congolensis]MBO3135435.1 glycosyltransferase family 2 protein [Dermatophilus congolensis]MBO3137675.1 glycosyltransferase family 2 protein [Dermatophilus congolensis]
MTPANDGTERNSTDAAPTVSVIIPTYKRLGVLQRALESVYSQTFTDWEAIVVDDHGQDGTAEYMAGVSDPRVRFYEHEVNKGGNAARSTGIAHARGEWIAFLDSDDAWRPTKLEKQLAMLRASGPEYGLAGCGIEHYAPDGTSEMVQIPQVDGWIATEMMTWNPLGGFSAIIVRRSALLQAGGLDASMPAQQDWEFYVRVSRLVAVCVVREVLVDYLVDPHDPIRITVDNSRVVKGMRRMWAHVLQHRDELTPEQRERAVRYFTTMLANVGAVGDVALILRSGMVPARPGEVKHGAHMFVRSIRNQVRAAAEGQRRAAELVRPRSKHTKISHI